jgi:hypothetical protein
VKTRTCGNAFFLLDQAQARISAQRRPPAPRESLLSALYPAAKALTRAAECLDAAEELREEARALVLEALETAEAAVCACVGAYVAGTPESPRYVPLDPQRFVPALADTGEPGEPEPAAGAS